MPEAIPAGFEGIIPHLALNDCAAAIEFYKNAFGAVELMRMPAPDGKRLMHACIAIGNQKIYLADDFGEECGQKQSNPKALGGTAVVLHRFVEDCDATIERAWNAGATIVMPATDMFWGDRYGVITDPFGHQWSFSTHQKDLTPEEMQAAAAAAMPMSGS